MPIDWAVVATIAAPIIALFVGAALNKAIQERPKVICYLGHVSGITLANQQPPLHVNSHSIVLRNAGRQAATNVRLGHAVLPNFQIYPDIDYTVSNLPGGESEIRIPSLVPQKQITITYLYFPPLTWGQVNTHLESDHGPVRVLQVLPTVQHPRWVRNIVAALIIYGAIALLYSIYTLVFKLLG